MKEEQERNGRGVTPLGSGQENCPPGSNPVAVPGLPTNGETYESAIVIVLASCPSEQSGRLFPVAISAEHLGQLLTVLAGCTVGHCVGCGDRAGVVGIAAFELLAVFGSLVVELVSEGRLGETIALYEQTLADRERVLGVEHPDTLGSRNNLAGAYEAVGRLEEAIALYEQTLADQERGLGVEHPNTLIYRNNLAYIYGTAGHLEKAIPLYEQALADCERILGPQHPTTGVVRGNLAASRKQRSIQ
ncbi:tetratricopeptide repeat-containing protein [Nocardia abscessus]|uniref:tetratricopeptide repeat-containing protein n=1 Tax=Nocardia abscessus TaxID=120957 RepID=UPI002454DEEF|nr:tetratricopeptide repeat-containing protein [Nocardia abscessus]